MVKKTATELGQMLSEEKKKLKQQQQARDDLAAAVIKVESKNRQGQTMQNARS